MSIVRAASSVEGPAPFQIFPSWLGKQSKRMKHQRNLNDMSRRGGFSSSMSFLDSLDLLRSHFFTIPGAEETVRELDMYNFTRDDMLETMVDTVFMGEEDSIKLDTKKKAAITREWKRTHTLDEKPVCVDFHSDSDDAESVDIEDV
jgi:hypothetical protein